MIKTVVILSPQRSASSLIAQALHTQIPMLPDPGAEYEDKRFTELNRRIVQAAGGSWAVPPSRRAIDATLPQFEKSIIKTIRLAEGAARKSKNLRYQGKDVLWWGWKSPLTCLTAQLYHPHLENPHYLLIVREPKEVAASMLRLPAGQKYERRPDKPLDYFEQDVARVYTQRAVQFLMEVGWL